MRRNRCVGCFCRRCGIENSTSAGWLHLSPAFCSRRLHSTCTRSTHHRHSITHLWPVPDFALSEWHPLSRLQALAHYAALKRSGVRAALDAISKYAALRHTAGITFIEAHDLTKARECTVQAVFCSTLAFQRPACRCLVGAGRCPPGCGSAQHGRLPSLPPCIEHAAEPDTLF